MPLRIRRRLHPRFVSHLPTIFTASSPPFTLPLLSFSCINICLSSFASVDILSLCIIPTYRLSAGGSTRPHTPIVCLHDSCIVFTSPRAGLTTKYYINSSCRGTFLFRLGAAYFLAATSLSGADRRLVWYLTSLSTLPWPTLLRRWADLLLLPKTFLSTKITILILLFSRFPTTLAMLALRPRPLPSTRPSLLPSLLPTLFAPE